MVVWVVYPKTGPEYWAPVAVFSSRELARKHVEEMRQQDPSATYHISDHTVDCEA